MNTRYTVSALHTLPSDVGKPSLKGGGQLISIDYRCVATENVLLI